MAHNANFFVGAVKHLNFFLLLFKRKVDYLFLICQFSLFLVFFKINSTEQHICNAQGKTEQLGDYRGRTCPKVCIDFQKIVGNIKQNRDAGKNVNTAVILVENCRNSTGGFKAEQKCCDDKKFPEVL